MSATRRPRCWLRRSSCIPGSLSCAALGRFVADPPGRSHTLPGLLVDRVILTDGCSTMASCWASSCCRCSPRRPRATRHAPCSLPRCSTSSTSSSTSRQHLASSCCAGTASTRRVCPPGSIALINLGFQSDRFVQLAMIVTAVCTVSFGPFLLVGGVSEIRQIVSRLFPFQRGLNHAYFAGNIWALATTVDRVLVRCSCVGSEIKLIRADLVSRGWPVRAGALKTASRGLIGDTTFGVLPQITPRHCFAISATIMAVRRRPTSSLMPQIYMGRLWFDPTYKRFVSAVVLCAFTSFIVGWHVHEKVGAASAEAALTRAGRAAVSGAPEPARRRQLVRLPLVRDRVERRNFRPLPAANTIGWCVTAPEGKLTRAQRRRSSCCTAPCGWSSSSAPSAARSRGAQGLRRNV